MKTRMKLLVTAVFCGGMLFNAASQINLNANTVQIRSQNNYYEKWTYNYGDLSVQDGSTNGSWGWLHCNKLVVNYNSDHASEINANVIVYRDLYVYGNKHFVHPHPTDDAKVIRYVATESGEALTLTRGTAKTVNGEATIKLPEHFSLVTSDKAPITVIITPKGAPVLLYTKEESKNQILIAMKKSDFAEFRDVEFAYQVTGVRDGFENQEVIIDAEKLNVSVTEPDNDVQKRIKAHAQRMEKRMEKRRVQVENVKE
jgi:hypothetical protein